MSLISAAQRTEPVARTVTILGSTGSVGRNTVELIQARPELFVVEAITGNKNVALLAEQARSLKAKLAVTADPHSYTALKDALGGSGIEVAAGPKALIDAACRPTDWLMASIVGAAGLEPTWEAARRGAVIGLANKECLVCAGELLMAEVARCGATIVPVDSEHSAIFQVFDFDAADSVEQIILTASGGPFRCYSREQLSSVTPEQAVAHPNWSMGAKISVDSATMMNKGLELIEAYHLFPVEASQIEIVVHPQSVIHSLVSYVDGSVLAQLGQPDMRTPIAFALAWPRRMKTPAARLSLAEVGQLSFEQPDEERFQALRLAREALQAGGAATAVLNAANEVAVHSFLNRDIQFLDIVRVVDGCLESSVGLKASSLSAVMNIDQQTREQARQLVAKCGFSKTYVN
ncbi:MAG: 1-deoxy-D-xylulose-5-phosphate reductoisomerase [Hyphomicrobiales bacterium]|nr:1-deoxy-D-xylulose-5-phosphate reductoisomerase [Hyphomicrobiales bacterium]